MIQRWRQALPAALIVHACNVLCALFVSLSLAGGVADPAADESTTVQALVVVLRLVEQASLTPLRYLGVPLASTLLVTPFLALLWLRATTSPERLEQHAQFARVRYARALGLALAWLAYAACLLLIAAGTALALRRLLAASHDERGQAGVMLLACLPFAAALLHGLSWFDAAQAALAQGAATARVALGTGLVHTTLGVVLLRSGFGLAGLVLTGVGLYAPRALFGLSAQGSIGTLAATQLLALAISLLRGAWLALLVERMQRSTNA
jgi:hypothetical protein